MSASDQRTFPLHGQTDRMYAVRAVKVAPDGYVVTVRPPRRSLDQSAKFHALCADIARARPEYAGIKMDADDWKALLILSHATATKGEGGKLRLVPDLEGEGYVQLRESSARMSVARSSSLIAYVEAWAAKQGIPLHDPAPARTDR